MNDTTRPGWQAFLKLCAEVNHTDDLDHLFKLFFTYEEQDAISGRYLIVKALLEKKQTQRQMAQELNVSIAKITRGSNELKGVDPDFKQRLIKWMQIN